MMQVILKEDIHNLGKAGEVVTVRPGYGRNYLIPQNKAAVATAGNVQQIEHQKKLIAAKNAKLAKDAGAIRDRLASVEVQIERQVGEEDKLFGSVTGRDITEALAAKGIQIDHKKLVIAEAIKTIGIHTVEVKLDHKVNDEIKVVVAPQGK